MNEDQQEIFEDFGEIVITALTASAVVTVFLVVEKIKNKIAPDVQRSQSVILKRFKWDFFLSLVTEGLIEILTNMAGHFLILATVGLYLKPYQIFLLITRAIMVTSTIYFSTKFLWNKILHDEDQM